MEFRQLLPEPATVDADDVLSELDTLAPPAARPYVLANFISSADGRATVNGRSGALGGEGDKALFHGLREHVDAVLVGTNTLRVERYGRLVSSAERRERRVQRGRTPEPLACVVTRTGALPLQIPLFASPEARMVIFSLVELNLETVAAQVDVVQLQEAELTLAVVLGRLRADFGVSTVLCEGGPTLFSSLLHERLVDELFLTLAPKLSGGGPALPITNGPALPEPAELTPVWVLADEGYTFLRYALR